MKANPYSLRALRASRSATIPHVPLSRDQRIAARAKNAKGTAVPVVLRHETAERVISAVLKRIEWPRHGSPVTLSATDKADAKAAGMLACVQARFFEHGIMSLRVVKSIRNAIQGPDCLRLRRTWETLVESPADVAAEVGFATQDVVSPRLTPLQRGMAKEVMRALRAAASADPSRKALASFQSQRGFFLMVLGDITGRGGRGISPVTFRQRAKRFLEYLADGARALRKSDARQPDVAKDILEALAFSYSESLESETLA